MPKKDDVDAVWFFSCSEHQMFWWWHDHLHRGHLTFQACESYILSLGVPWISRLVILFCEGFFLLPEQGCSLRQHLPKIHMHMCYECVARSYPLGFLTV